MPESPEVQALAEFLDEHLVGRSILAVDVLEFRAVKTRKRPPESIVGATVSAVSRHGKHLDLATDSGRLIVSLGRHGWVRWVDADAAPLPSGSPPALVRIDFGGADGAGGRDGGGSGDQAAVEITDAGGWVSIGLSIVDKPEEAPAIVGLGPDPLDPAFPRKHVEDVVRGRRKRLKALLTDQEVIAGIGNAYSDEILFAAGISPVAQGLQLGDGERGRLADAVTDVMRSSAGARRGVPIAELKTAKVAAMSVHGRTGEACPVCGGIVADVPGSKGTAQYCPSCQTGGAPPTPTA